MPNNFMPDILKKFGKRILMEKFPLIFKNIHIRHKIIFAVVLIIVFTMAFSGIYFNLVVSSILTKNAYDNLDQLITQAGENIENAIKTIDITSLHFFSNSIIRNWLSSDSSFSTDIYSNFMFKSQLEDELKYSMMFNSAWNFNLIQSAYLFIDESTFSYVARSTASIQETNNNISLYKKLSKNMKQGLTLIPPSDKYRTIYLSRNIINLNDRSQILYLIIGTNESVISDKYKKLLEYPGSVAYIIDRDGTIFSSHDKTALGKPIDRNLLNSKASDTNWEASLENETYFMARRNIGESGLTFIVGIPKNLVLSKLRDSMKNYLFIILIFAIIFLAVGILLSFRFTHFVKDVLLHINKVKSGNYDSFMPPYKDFDLNTISETFNSMSSEIKHLISQVYEKQLLLKDTNIKFLQSQMNPHFLFNTLVSVSTMAKLEGQETIYQMVYSLSSLLQAGIYSDGKTKITIAKELEYVEFYLYLQKIRFGEILDYKINLSNNSVPDLYIPRLCIEPIVENAVVHGIEPKISKGTVTVNIKKEADTVIFDIIDDGCGFEASEIDIESISDRKLNHNSIGLNNTNRRIKLIYGDSYGISIYSKPGSGTIVTVRIPVDEGDVSGV